MGHAIDYITVNKKSEIMAAAQEFAFYNVDRGENPDGSYHGDMHINESLIFDNEESARDYIKDYTSGKFYYDMAVRFKAHSKTFTKKRDALYEKARKIREQKKEYSKAHDISLLKSRLITCPTCESKINVHHKRYAGTYDNRCPLCRTDLRAGYIVEKHNAFDEKIRKVDAEIYDLERKDKGDSKNVKWLVKVEVQC